MNEEIAKIVYDYTKNNKFADYRFISKIIYLIAKEHELNNYITKTEIILPFSFEKNYSGSNYSMKTKELTIDISKITNRLKNKLLFNSSTVITIMHELDHTLMKKQMEENKDSLDIKLSKICYMPIDDISATLENKKPTKEELINFLKDMRSLTKVYIEYRKHHDMAPFEKRANIVSRCEYNEVFNLLKQTNLENIEKTRSYLLREFLRKMKYGYKLNGDITNSPSLDYIKLLKQEDKLKDLDIDGYTLKERILYGLSLTKEEYQNISIKNNPFNAFVLEKNIKK